MISVLKTLDVDLRFKSEILLMVVESADFEVCGLDWMIRLAFSVVKKFLLVFQLSSSL